MTTIVVSDFVAAVCIPNTGQHFLLWWMLFALALERAGGFELQLTCACKGHILPYGLSIKWGIRDAGCSTS